MDFELDDTQRMVRDTARAFARSTVAPRAKAIDDEGSIPKEMLHELAKLGLMGVNVPDALGGAEAGVIAYSLAMTEIAAACASTAVTMAVNNMVSEVLVAFDNTDQQRRYVPMTTSGRYVAGFALSEAEAGSDPGGLRTTARRDGRSWVIDGAKQWISHADTCGMLVVWARTGGEGPRGLSCFLVEPGTAGFSVTGKEDKLGLRGSHTCSILLDNVRVPEEALLGGEGHGFRIAMMALDGGRIGIASQALGIAEAALEAGIAYAKERKTFGKPIADYQAIQWMIADSRMELDAARLLTLRAAKLKEAKVPFTREASMAKLFATEAAWQVCDRALQIHGGYGYTRDFPVERHLRDVRVTRIYEGTSEIQRVVVSRSVLKGS